MCAGTPRPALERVRVLLNERIAEGIGRIVLSAPQTAPAVLPGQFVHLRISEGADFILRRPLSIHRVVGDTLEILYQVVGRGTLVLADRAPGAEMDVIGPIGHGWQMPTDARHALVVAGGVGAAPMGMLVEELAARGVAVTYVCGAPTAERLLARDHFDALARRTAYATDDGSLGTHGYVTELIADALGQDRPDVVYACGPEVMQRKAAQAAAEAGVPCQVSLERLMGCGIGACLSCVVSTVSGRKRACVDGPVFDAAELLWDATETRGVHV